MYLDQPTSSIQPQVSAFDELLSSVSGVAQIQQLSVRGSKFRGEFQIYSDEQARSVLWKLFERNKPKAQKKNWKIEQTNLLCFIVDKYQTAHGITNQPLGQFDWQKIAQCIPNRDASACRFRYLSLTSPNISQQPWSQMEIQSMQQDSINWKKISQKLYDFGLEKIYRTGKQCREHYTCFLRPNLKKGQWTNDQDYIMICLFLNYGKKWSKMTKFIQGRNENSIKNRFFLVFQNKVKAKFSHSDLVKLARRKKQKLQKTINSTIADEVKKERQSIVEMPTQEAAEQSEYNLEQQEIQERNQEEIMIVSEKNQQQGLEAEQKCELDFTQDFQKYIDL